MKSVSNISRGQDSQSPSKKGWLPKAACAATLALSLGLTACSHDYSLAWVYAPSASLTSGLINAYRVDFQNGQLTLLPDSPIPSGGRKPSGLVALPNHKAIFVINHDDSNVVQFEIGTDGKLYPTNTYDIASQSAVGSFPTALAVSADGKFLYVTYTYQQGYTTASPGPGGIIVFTIKSDDSLVPIPVPSATTADVPPTPQYFPIGRAPVGIVTSPTPGFVYVIAQDSAAVGSGATQTSNLFAFTADASTGALTLQAGQTINAGNVPSLGLPSGTTPSGIIEDQTGTHLYIADGTANTVISYSIANGLPAQISGGTATTGAGPRGLAFDPTGKFLFVANYDGTIGEYTFGSNGAPVLSTSAASTNAGSGTTCVTVEPTRGIYLYASGSLSNNVFGEEIEPSTGALKPIFHSPYEASTLPVCAITVPNPTAGQ
ncbi:DNA-binding beta-propeller fold protein YncE [Granulicella aggregans]|uniref:DNA-binding beta-propeller fold protein YncE n=1 Tax=Granulicella aggregans TaxID=474949 RepID=A0A7W8E224_9BACT|nr:beta-propeller fold lactonase family protein [Granulicella aggregans]MBB5056448.1 DNA-binding beta-propeller fold protein YncE [Granulicella aggregans]